MSRWNHNIHYHPVILEAVPAATERVLDVGCGEGMLTQALAGRAKRVVGLDRNEAVLEVARHSAPAPNVEYVAGDLLDFEDETGPFDAVVSVAVVHHIGTERALRRMAELVRPGGVIAVVGLARSRLPRDLPYEAAAAAATRLHKLRKSHWESAAPVVWPPDVTYREARAIAERVLAGCRFRRRLLWRWTVVWTRPG